MTLDLGISGRRALVCAASKGLGRACATALARAGAPVTIVGRTQASLSEAARDIAAATGGDVDYVSADVTTEAGFDAIRAHLPDPDILINNTGGPPIGDVLDFSMDQWRTAVDSNMIAHLRLTQAVIGTMCDRKFGRIVNITSASVKSPLPFLGLSVGARMGLTGAMAVIARQVAMHNVTVNNILPGAFLTDRLRDNLSKKGGEFETELAKLAASVPTRRIGNPRELGDLCAFLCSANAGYIVGQNIVIDGGNFNASLG